MGKLLDFKPRTVVPLGEPVVQDFAKLYAHTLDVVRDLVNYYKGAGTWSDEKCDSRVIQAISEFRTVCTIIAGENNEQPAPRIG